MSRVAAYQMELLYRVAVIMHHTWIMEAFLTEVIDRVLHTFGMMRNLSEEALRDARESLRNYIETLSSAGETDPQRLAVCGLTYLRNRHDDASSKFASSKYTGC
jgi:hypothetical protein